MNDFLPFSETPSDEPPPLDRRADLETVLAAWHAATLRLEKTHAALQSEVVRLRSELEVKNRELARKNRLADLGRMASHVAHEVRNNLVPVSLYMSLLRRRLSEDSGSLDVLAKVESGILALDTTVNDLLHFTSHRDPQWESFALRELIEEICASLGPQLDAQRIAAEIDVPGELRLRADRDLLRRALLNLALNALDAMRDGGALTFTAYDGAEGVEIEVADSGEGLSDEARNRAFEPFFTTKKTGTGLGLAIVDRVAEAHGGRVTATNCPEGGAAITLALPQPAATRAIKAAALSIPRSTNPLPPRPGACWWSMTTHAPANRSPTCCATAAIGSNAARARSRRSSCWTTRASTSSSPICKCRACRGWSSSNTSTARSWACRS
jgi:signal transduction histidine kinase